MDSVLGVPKKSLLVKKIRALRTHLLLLVIKTSELLPNQHIPFYAVQSLKLTLAINEVSDYESCLHIFD